MRRELPPALTWTLLALLGLLVAVAVGIAASDLTSRRIGLSSEPIRAGDALAPKEAHHHPRGHGGTTPAGGDDDAAPGGTDDSAAPPATTAPDDSSGETTSDGDDD